MRPGGVHGGDSEEQDLFDVRDDELQIAIPAQPAEVTPMFKLKWSSMCWRSSHSSTSTRRGDPVYTLSRATIAESRLIPQEEFNLVHLLNKAHHLALDPPQERPKFPSMPLSSLLSTSIANTLQTAQTYPREWRPLGAKPKSPSGTLPPGYDQNGAGSGGDGTVSP